MRVADILRSWREGQQQPPKTKNWLGAFRAARMKHDGVKAEPIGVVPSTPLTPDPLAEGHLPIAHLKPVDVIARGNASERGKYGNDVDIGGRLLMTRIAKSVNLILGGRF